MNIELRPCPICNTPGLIHEDDPEWVRCRSSNCPVTIMPLRDWNTRPIEDALRKRISELEEENLILEKWLREKKSRISELESVLALYKISVPERDGK
jgi:hypothetical protein